MSRPTRPSSSARRSRPIGAEKAGNKDGTIPEYTGGLTTPPAGYQKGSDIRPDPFAGEKPRLTITGKDMAAHADKLTEGTKELLKRYATMRVDVYPTHRTVLVPQRILDNTQKNATGAKTIEGGLGVEDVLAGYPFPIPKTGYEVMWNHLLRYSGLALQRASTTTGTSTPPACRPSHRPATAIYAWPIYDPEEDRDHEGHRPVLVRQAAVRRRRRAATARRCWSWTRSTR